MSGRIDPDKLRGLVAVAQDEATPKTLRSMARSELLETFPALLDEMERLRWALVDFLENPQFQVAVGGNPIAVKAMLERARLVLGREVSK